MAEGEHSGHVEPALRRTLNLVNLSTPLGRLLARLGGARVIPREGLLLAVGYRLPVPAAPAFTVGDVVVVRDPGLLARRPALWRHEARHAEQWARCAGLPFLPLYGLAALWSWWRTGDPASANPFERAAGLADGGYLARPTRRPRRGE